MEQDIPKVNQFITYIEKNNQEKLIALTEKYHARDIATNVIAKLTITQVSKLFSIINNSEFALMFSYLGYIKAEEIIDAFSNEDIKKIFEELETSETIDLIDSFSKSIVEKILTSVSEEKKKEINLLLKYSISNVGHHMSVDFVVLKKSMNIRKAIAEIKKYKEKSTVERLPFTYFVVDKSNSLIGHIDYEELLFEKQTTPLEKIIKPTQFVKTRENISKAIEQFKNYKLETLAVVNTQNELVGTLDSDAILDAVESEYIEDFDKISGINESERNYLTRPVRSIVKSRAGWLVSLLFVATFTQLAIELFMSVIWGIESGSSTLTGAQLTAVTTAIAVMPILIDSAGNAGGQSTGSIIRSLALKEVTPKDWKIVAKKEIQIGILVGLVMFTGNYVRMIFVDLITYQGYTMLPDGTTIGDIMLVNLVTSISLAVAMVMAKFVGSLAPLVARRFGLDEASVSSPMITTVLDLMVVFVFFGLISIAFFAV